MSVQLVSGIAHLLLQNVGEYVDVRQCVALQL